MKLNIEYLEYYSKLKTSAVTNYMLQNKLLKNQKLFFLLLIFVPFNFYAFSFSEPFDSIFDLNTRYIGIEDGLSHNSVTAIHQDTKGFMWIGTFDGLNKFNGYEFTVYRNRPGDSTSILNNRIETIYSHKNYVYIGTKNGLSVYDYYTDSFSPRYSVDNLGNRILLTTPVNEIIGSSEKIYVATAGAGLMVTDTSGQKELRKIPLEIENGISWDYHAQTLEFDPDGKLWVFVQGVGITKYNEKQNKLEIQSSEIISGHSMVFGTNAELWIGLDNGVLKYDTQTRDYQFFTGEDMNFEIKELAFLEDSEQVWAASDGNGVLIYDKEQKKFRAFPDKFNNSQILRTRSIYSIYIDKDGRKWIGTRGGISLILDEKMPFKTISKETTRGLPSNFILSFSEENSNKLWIGTDGEGLSLYDRSKSSFTNYSRDTEEPNSLSSDFITSLKKNGEGLWIGTYGGGVNLLNQKTGEFEKYRLYNTRTENYQDNVWVLYKDIRENLWAATSSQEGLFRYDKDADQFQYINTGISGVLSIAQNEEDVFWLGTFDKLYAFDLKKGIAKLYQINYPVRSLKFASNNVLLIGTEGGGLISLDIVSNKRKIYTQENGLPNNSILNILEDASGNFWMSTYKGISEFNYQNKTFKNFYASDGLQSNQFNYNAALKLSTGELLFGGIKGFNIIDPEIPSIQTDFPNLVISQIKINNVSLSKIGKAPYELSSLELPYDQSMVSVEFVALEYSKPDKIRYAYFLEGWDMKWHYIGEGRVANYSKLTEGDYILHIKSTNADGEWNNETLTFPIEILPPWYRSTIAYILYVLLFCAILWAIIFVQRRQSRLRYEVKLSRQKAEQEKELNEKKLSFFTNVSHEFRSPLTMIINPLKDIMYGKEQEIDPGAIEVIYRNSRRLLSLVDQLMLFRKVESETGDIHPVKYDIVHLCKEVFTCFVHQAKTKGIEYNLNADISSLDVYIDRQKIEIVLFNLIANALKFTEKDVGIVSVNLEDRKNSVLIEVSDNGEGITEKERERVFELFYQSNKNHMNKRKGFGIGLYLVKQIIEKHKGEVKCGSSELGGTTFSIQLQKGKEHLGEYKIEDAPNLEESLLIDLEEENNIKNSSRDSHTTEEQLPSEEIVASKRSILVIDDNPQIRAYLNRILNDSYVVKQAASAEEGLELLKQRTFDFIVSDVVMDGMNGVEFCKIVKNDKNLKHIPVILLTAGTSEELKLTGVEVGADDYLTKPFDKNYLRARIKGILKRREAVQDYFLRKVTNAETDVRLSDEDKEFIDRIIEVVDANLVEEEFNAKNMAKEIGMSQSLLYKKIKQITGKSSSEFIRFLRLRKVATTLITTDVQINQAATNAGFGDIKYFRNQFKQQYKMTPSAFRKKYKNIKNKKYILND